MCFSPEADLVSGIVVVGFGVDAVRHVERPNQRALAAIPLLLGFHQLFEAVVWWSLRGDLPEDWWLVAAWCYLLIAFGVLPVLVPVAIGALEPESNRPRVRVFMALGAVVSVVLLVAMVRGPVEASIEARHIDYRIDLWRGGLIVALYVLATCGSLLVSSHRHVRWFGGVNLVVVLALSWLDRSALISLWCAWAAVTSIAITWHLRWSARAGRARQLSPAGSPPAPRAQLAPRPDR